MCSFKKQNATTHEIVSFILKCWVYLRPDIEFFLRDNVISREKLSQVAVKESDGISMLKIPDCYQTNNIFWK